MKLSSIFNFFFSEDNYNDEGEWSAGNDSGPVTRGSSEQAVTSKKAFQPKRRKAAARIPLNKRPELKQRIEETMYKVDEILAQLDSDSTINDNEA